MKIVDIIKPIGQCYGVNNAIQIAKQAAVDNPNKRVNIFGLLVHNNDVKKELEGLNIKTIEVEDGEEINILKSFKKDDLVIFTAHGHPKKYEEILNNLGVRFIDTTCPIVQKSFDLIKQAKETIYIGKNGHPETKAALTMNEQVHLYDINSGIDFSKILTNDPLVINQTTLSFLELEEIHKDIKKHIENAQILDEICNVTMLRQKAIRNISNDVEVIIVVGSKKSSNTLKLFEVAKNFHIGKHILFVENVNELNEDLSKYNRFAITGGTSTPLSKIEEIKRYLEAL